MSGHLLTEAGQPIFSLEMIIQSYFLSRNEIGWRLPNKPEIY